jgi:hypothetical protein
VTGETDAADASGRVPSTGCARCTCGSAGSWADELDRSAGFPCAYRDFLQVCLEAALVQRALEELDGIERLDIRLAAPGGFV